VPAFLCIESGAVFGTAGYEGIWESQHVTSRDLCATIEQCRNPDLVLKGGAIAEDFSLALKISAESQEEGDGLYKAHCACM